MGLFGRAVSPKRLKSKKKKKEWAWYDPLLKMTLGVHATGTPSSVAVKLAKRVFMEQNPRVSSVQFCFVQIGGTGIAPGKPKPAFCVTVKRTKKSVTPGRPAFLGDTIFKYTLAGPPKPLKLM